MAAIETAPVGEHLAKPVMDAMRLARDPESKRMQAELALRNMLRENGKRFAALMTYAAVLGDGKDVEKQIADYVSLVCP